MTELVIFCIIPFQNGINQLTANIFSERTAAASNDRKLCTGFFHELSLARQFTKKPLLHGNWRSPYITYHNDIS